MPSLGLTHPLIPRTGTLVIRKKTPRQDTQARVAALGDNLAQPCPGAPTHTAVDKANVCAGPGDLQTFNAFFRSSKHRPTPVPKATADLR